MFGRQRTTSKKRSTVCELSILRKKKLESWSTGKISILVKSIKFICNYRVTPSVSMIKLIEDLDGENGFKKFKNIILKK